MKERKLLNKLTDGHTIILLLLYKLVGFVIWLCCAVLLLLCVVYEKSYKRECILHTHGVFIIIKKYLITPGWLGDKSYLISLH